MVGPLFSYGICMVGTDRHPVPSTQPKVELSVDDTDV
jgi:hypothetical protein